MRYARNSSSVSATYQCSEVHGWLHVHITLTRFSFFSRQLSFQEWTQQMRDLLEARKRGDFAFRDKDFKTAIDCYSQVCSQFRVQIY